MSKFSAIHTIYTEALFQERLKRFASFLPEAGLSEFIYAHPDHAVPLAGFVALWELLGTRIDPDIGLLIGNEPSTHGLGGYGQLVSSACDMQASLRCMSRYIVVHSQATRLDVSFTESHIIIDYQLTDPTITRRRQDAELSLAMIATNLRAITGRELYPIKVQFEHAVPDNCERHAAVFRCPVEFESSSNRLFYSSDLLNLPVVTADARLHQALLASLDEQRKLRSAESSFVDNLIQVIMSCLPNGEVSLEHVARHRGMSARTLQRRLSEQQIDFSALIEEVRRSLALDYVSSSRYTLTEVALMLGYSEASSFSRAFRRWTQVTPLQYRQSSRCA